MSVFVGERKYQKTEKYPYECPFCDSSWGRVEYLQKHITEQHKDDLKEASKTIEPETMNCEG